MHVHQQHQQGFVHADLGDLRQRCHAAGMRLTVQKTAVFEAVCNTTAHPTVDDVCASVQQKLPQVARTTVARILDEFVQHGIVRRVCHSGRSMRFDANLAPHHHLHCLGCDQIRDVILPELDTMLQRVSLNDFTCTEATTIFRGWCRQCRPRPKTHHAPEQEDASWTETR